MRIFTALAIAAGLAFVSGCARDRGQITPTTLGTDFSRAPAGRMTPQSFPGSSLSDQKRRVFDNPVLTAGSTDVVRR